VEFSAVGGADEARACLELHATVEGASVSAGGFIASVHPRECLTVTGPEGAACTVSGEGHAVISAPLGGGSIRFVVCMGGYDPADLAAAGREFAGGDWGALFEGRMRWVSSLPLPSPDMPEAVERTYRRACSAMRTNCCTAEGYIRTAWTTPDRWPHRHCYLWDSAFQSVGYVRFDPVWGRNAIRGMLSGLEGSGMVRSMLTPMGPGKPQTNAPCLGWAAWDCYRFGAGREFLEETYPHLAASARCNLTHADEALGGLLVWPYFSHGMDNSQRFDDGEPLVFADLNLHMCADLRNLARIARVLGREAEAAEWLAVRERLAAEVNRRLWDDELGFYFDLNEDGTLRRIFTATAFVALFAGIADEARAGSLMQRLFDPAQFWSPLPVRTTSAAEPEYSKDMWRGPVWPNYDVMLVRALDEYGRSDMADELANRYMDEVVRWYEATGSIYEFYDAEAEESPTVLPRKRGYGALHDYGFGLAAFIDFAWRRWSPTPQLSS